jgi:hypothetical protein
VNKDLQEIFETVLKHSIIIKEMQDILRNIPCDPNETIPSHGYTAIKNIPTL